MSSSSSKNNTNKRPSRSKKRTVTRLILRSFSPLRRGSNSSNNDDRSNSKTASTSSTTDNSSLSSSHRDARKERRRFMKRPSSTGDLEDLRKVIHEQQQQQQQQRCFTSLPETTPPTQKRRLNKNKTTSILLHTESFNINNKTSFETNCGEDPTVQESIECVFADDLKRNNGMIALEDCYWDPLIDCSESEQGYDQPDRLKIVHLVDCHHDEDDEDNEGSNREARRVVRPINVKRTPTKPPLMKKSPIGSNGNSHSHSPPKSSSSSNSSRSQKYFFDAVQSESDISLMDMDTSYPSLALADSQPPCCHHCSAFDAPILNPSHWPQYPLLLRPTPNSGTVIRGVRYSSDTTYLPHPWPTSLQQMWQTSDKTTAAPNNHHDDNEEGYTCPHCMILPINNGNEPPGKCLVADFESHLFIGTLLIRIRNSNGTTPHPYNDSKGYFTGMNRRYQAVVRGKFKRPIPMTECVTGHTLKRPCGRLPPRWIRMAALKILSFFAPQLQAKFDSRPSFLSPLVSTSQAIVSEPLVVSSSMQQQQQQKQRNDGEKQDYAPNRINNIQMEDPVIEPSDSTSLLNTLPNVKPSSSSSNNNNTTSIQRAKYRKLVFDKLFSQKKKTPLFQSSNNQYTFEFLQHLIQFKDLSIELGQYVGKISLREMLDGQPLKFMGARQVCEKQDDDGGGGKGKLEYLWSFDVWHDCLFETAKRYDDLKRRKKNGM